MNNSFRIVRNGEEIIKIPVWGLALAFLISWPVTLTALFFALFFGCRYSFEGKDNLEGSNDMMDKASRFAEKVKDEYEKL